MPVPVYVDTGNANCFAVGLPRLGGSLDDHTDFDRVLPFAQRSVHGDMLNRCAYERGQALSDDFAVTAFAIATTHGERLALERRSNGWHDAAGQPLPAFDTCIDIDLAGTPFTNTLPIRRERWEIGQSREFAMLYIPFDDFVPRLDRQIYICLAPRLFRYQAVDRSFEAELPVDEDGLVLDYPSLFERIR